MAERRVSRATGGAPRVLETALQNLLKVEIDFLSGMLEIQFCLKELVRRTLNVLSSREFSPLLEHHNFLRNYLGFSHYHRGTF